METEFTCSAGVAHNKILAKLASAMNKPAQQTVVPLASVKGLLDLLPVKKMKQLGGKLGTSLQSELGVNTVGDLLKFSEDKLQELYGVNTGEEQKEMNIYVQHWLNQLSDELSERLCSDLEQNKRIARTLTLHVSAFRVTFVLQSSDTDSLKKFPSKSCPLRYGTAKIQDDAFNLFQAGLREYLGSYGVKTQGSHYNGWGVTALSVSASKIVPTLSGTCSITKYFHGQDASDSSLKQSPDTFARNIAPLSPSGSESYSELNPTEPQVKFPSEEVQMKLSVAGLGQQEDQSCSSIQQASCSFTPEVSPFSCSGSESFSGLNQSKQQRDQVHSDDSRIKPIMTNLKQQEQKRNALKDKGTSSILNFFKSQNPSCSSWKEEHVEASQNAKATVGDCCSKLIQVQQPIESFLLETATNSGRSGSDQIQQTSEAWNYRIEEIDPTVIDELPPQIQDEIRAWLRPHKRPNIVKRGSSIADYFIPSKNR
ncbi:hypothetical protein Patl1_12157 [Pistacia atlantica]|uniref:Uncharacterized protein n=1 Tax=Pistacia atlantica TaxID=434234 RepID=A0ACC1A8G4_9ROSI|nr:hypothetical protein Patl1_12157 [Pistacia atlantica]